MTHRFTLEEIGHGFKATLSDSQIIRLVLNDRVVTLEPYSPIREKLQELQSKLRNDCCQYKGGIMKKQERIDLIQSYKKDLEDLKNENPSNPNAIKAMKQIIKDLRKPQYVNPNPHCPQCGKDMREHKFKELLECYAEHSGSNEQ